MSRLLPIYFNVLFGALGGLLGWLLFGELVSQDWEWWVQAIVGGALIGAVIGYFVVGVDALRDRALVRFCRYAAYGIVLGCFGGAAGLWAGDWVNYLLVPESGQALTAWQLTVTVLARGFGWMFLGLAVGASEGVAARSMGKLWYGTVGGTLGGFVGGAIFGWLIATAREQGALDRDAPIYTWGPAVGLVILGACIGGLIALVEEVLKPAAVKVLRGWQEGREYPLTKPASVLGRDEGVDVLLLRDMKVEKRHAVIHRRGDRFVLVNNHAPADQTLVNGEPVAQSCELRDGDRIQFGNVVLRFLARK